MELKEGLVKYNNFIFWWKVDSDKYGQSFRRYWRLRQAYNSGMLDFYTRLLIIIGGVTVVYGVYRGYKKRGNTSYRERVNELKLEELELDL